MIPQAMFFGGKSVAQPTVKNSLRLRGSANANLSKTFGTPSDGKRYTFGILFKRGALANGTILSEASNNKIFFYSDLIGIQENFGGYTADAFRDPAGWSHYHMTHDSTSGVQMGYAYINNSLVKSGALSLNAASIFNASGSYVIGYNSGGGAFDGVIALVYRIDGQALAPTVFAEYNASGEWKPKSVSAIKTAVAAAGGASNFYKVTAGMLSQSGLNSFTAANVVDGNTSTANAFYTDTSPAGSFLKVDLGAGNARELTRVEIYANLAGANATWDVQYSNDDTNWSTAYTGLNAATATSTVPAAAYWNSVGSARYWRLYKTNSAVSGNWHTEVKWFEKDVTGFGNNGFLLDFADTTGLTSLTPVTHGTAVSGGYWDGSSLPANAIDGNATGTSWQSSQRNTDCINTAYIGETWATPKTFSRVRIKSDNGGSGGVNYIPTMYFQTYDGSTWTTQQTLTGASADQYFDLHTEYTAYGYRFLAGASPAGGTVTWVVFEIEAYANTGLGKDVSGKGHFWVTNNISLTSGATYDALIDSPTNDSASSTRPVGNYPTLDPNVPGLAVKPSNGNLSINQPSAAWANGRATFPFPSTGSWYAEATFNQNSTGSGPCPTFGVCKSTLSMATTDQGGGVGAWSLNWDNYRRLTINGTRPYTADTYTANQVMQVAWDATNQKLWLGRNNSWYDTVTTTAGDPSTGANPTASGIGNDIYVFCQVLGAGQIDINFGQRPFAYTPPTGFKALCTTNLPQSAIDNPKKHFNVDTYAGTSSAQNRTGFLFKPDFAWIKSRGPTAKSHVLVDAIRGVTKQLNSDSTAAESTNSAGNGLQSFNSDGYSLGAESDAAGSTNLSGHSYVAWLLKAGGTGVSNTDGSITSTVSANTAAGISVVSWTGNGSLATIGHGLGKVPAFIITRNRTGAGGGNWNSYHVGTGNTKAVYLNLTDAAVASINYWNNTSPTSTVFTVAASMNLASTYVAYCFAEIDGFSKAFNFSGNSSADGAYIYLGFRARFILLKRIDTANDWIIWDTARSTYNSVSAFLYPDLANAESTGVDIDVTCNAIKMRTTNAICNVGNYIGFAFAEYPFASNANAR